MCKYNINTKFYIHVITTRNPLIYLLERRHLLLYEVKESKQELLCILLYGVCMVCVWCAHVVCMGCVPGSPR